MRTLRERWRGQDGFSLVELLVVVVLLGVVGAGTTAVVVTTSQAQKYNDDLRITMDDARTSVARVRKELRAARRVYVDSTSSLVHFWVDQNQDALEDAAERFCFTTRLIPGTVDQYELVKWTEDLGSCSATPPAGAVAVARTLRQAAVFTYDPVPTGPLDPDQIRTVTLDLDFDANTNRGPQSLPVTVTVRLRNVS